MNHYTFAIKDAKDDAQSSLVSFCRPSEVPKHYAAIYICHKFDPLIYKPVFALY